MVGHYPKIQGLWSSAVSRAGDSSGATFHRAFRFPPVGPQVQKPHRLRQRGIRGVLARRFFAGLAVVVQSLKTQLVNVKMGGKSNGGSSTPKTSGEHQNGNEMDAPPQNGIAIGDAPWPYEAPPLGGSPEKMQRGCMSMGGNLKLPTALKSS